RPHPGPNEGIATLGDLRMNVLILGWALAIAQTLLGLAMLFSTFRLIRGPRAQDRVGGLDSLYANAMLLMVVFGIRTGTPLFFEATVIIAGVGFASSSALATSLKRGEVIE